MAIIATYTSTCPTCDELIEPGDPIDRLAVGEPWSHFLCLIKTTEVACPRCNYVLALSGACGCDE